MLRIAKCEKQKLDKALNAICTLVIATVNTYSKLESPSA